MLTFFRVPQYTSWQRRGFTIVELLIVIVVIGILAAITIVAFNGVQNRAKASAAQSAVAQANKKVLAYAAQNSDMYPPDLESAGITNTDGLQYSYNNTSSPRTYGLTATKDTTSYFVSNTVAQPSLGGYMGHGSGGVAAITNLVINPKLALASSSWGARASTGGAPSTSRLVGQVTFDPSVTTTYRVTLGGAAATWWRVYTVGAAVTAGLPYTVSAWIKPSVTSNTSVIIIWRDAAGASISETGSVVSTHPAGVWQRRSWTATAPPNAVSVQLESNASNNGVAGATLDATAAMLEQSSTLHDYADGDTSGWAWNGSPHSATSSGMPL